MQRKRSATPERIQFVRGKPMRSPNGLPYVGRPSRFGNPFKIGSRGIPDRRSAVRLYEKHLAGKPELIDQARRMLQGKNLACWCPLDGEPCHADVLLAVANKVKR
jgi:Domain of unknown function (DUF4326)